MFAQIILEQTMFIWLSNYLIIYLIIIKQYQINDKLLTNLIKSFLQISLTSDSVLKRQQELLRNIFLEFIESTIMILTAKELDVFIAWRMRFLLNTNMN